MSLESILKNKFMEVSMMGNITDYSSLAKQTADEIKALQLTEGEIKKIVNKHFYWLEIERELNALIQALIKARKKKEGLK